MPPTQKHKNHLLLIRNKVSLGQKQVAVILGHKTTDQISRYERRTKLPNLKTAFKLSIIYRVPVEVLFYGYYEACLKELIKRAKSLRIQESKFDLVEGETKNMLEFCTFAEKLKPFSVTEPELDKVRHHIAELINARSARMKHFLEE